MQMLNPADTSCSFLFQAGYLAPKPELIAQLENAEEPWVPDSEGSEGTKVAHNNSGKEVFGVLTAFAEHLAHLE